MRPLRGSEEGATAITIAITMLVLMGFTALALDGGGVYNERRSTHNAADHAALAAAWAACNGNSPETAGVEAAEQNGYTDTEVTIVNEGGDRYRATVTAVEATTFARLIGADEVTVVSEAVADCTFLNSLGGFGIYGGAPPSCPTTVNIPSAAKTIHGGVHSQGDFQSTGAAMFTDYQGPATYVGDLNTNHSGSFNGGLDQVDPYPSTYWMVPEEWLDVNYFRNRTQASTSDNEFYFSGNQLWTNSDLSQDGLYFVDGDVQLLGADETNVTIVATGDIHLSGVNNSLTPYNPLDDALAGLVLLSFEDAGSYTEGDTESCSAIAIHGSAAGNAWEGVMFAPNGQIRLNNAGSFTIDGSLIGYRVNLAGGAVNITYDDQFGVGPIWTVELTE